MLAMCRLTLNFASFYFALDILDEVLHNSRIALPCPGIKCQLDSASMAGALAVACDLPLTRPSMPRSASIHASRILL